MNSWCYFLLLAAVYPATSSELQVDDFDNFIRDFGNKKVGPSNWVAWSDAYYVEPNLKDMENKSYCQIKVFTSNMAYQNPDSPTDRPSKVFSQVFRNDATNPLSQTIETEIQTADSYSWSTKFHFGIGYEVSFEAGFPGLADVSASLGASFDLNTGSTTSDKRVEVAKKSISFDVPPRKTLNVTIVKTDQEMIIPWTADIIVTGYVAISYEKEYDGKFFHCYPVSDLASGRFQRTDNGLKYKAKGVLKAVKGSRTSTFFKLEKL